MGLANTCPGRCHHGKAMWARLAAWARTHTRAILRRDSMMGKIDLPIQKWTHADTPRNQLMDEDCLVPPRFTAVLTCVLRRRRRLV